MFEFELIAALVIDALAAAGAWLLTPTGTMTATSLGVVSAIITVWQFLKPGKQREAKDAADALDTTPAAASSIADQLKARYGTGYAGFLTLDQVDKLIAERTRHFFGRDDQLAVLDAFVAENSRGVMVIAAPGGFGKSALLANWGQRREHQGAAVAYHFFNATAHRTTERTDALRALITQIAFLRGRPAPSLPDDPGKLEDLLNQEVCQDATPERPLIVILDGLDEAAERVAPIAPAALGSHVYIFASGRAEPGQRPEHFARWLDEAGRVGYPLVRHNIPELSVEGVLAWVRGLLPGLPADQEARLAQRLAATSQRVPLFLQFIVDDIRDRRERGEALAAIIGSLEALPAPFTGYAAQQLGAMREMRGAFEIDVARFFALLNLIKGALRVEELRQVLGIKANPWDFDPRITRWFARRSSEGERAIAFLHPRLADVFRETLRASDSMADTLAEVEGRLIDHCRASWVKASRYALTNLPLHQLEAGRIDDAVATLTDLAFLGARLSHAAAQALIVRTMQDFEAADTAAPAGLLAETRPRRFFWATAEQHLLALARGPQHGRSVEALHQLLRDNPETERRYATRHTAWLQIVGRRPPPPLLRELKGHSGSVYGATALSDGRLLSWSDFDGTLRLWAADGAPLSELKGHSDRVRGATALSDGRLLSWGDDGTLRLWAADGAFESLWLWPYAGVTEVIPHPDRPNVYWVIADDVLQVRHQPEGAIEVEQTYDVFLSYAREDADTIRALYADLTGAGFSVWYDKGLVGGDRYRDHIRARIDAARAVVVLWSRASVKADWVIAEASRAHGQGKLVPVRLPPLASSEIPDPFGVLATLPHGDLDALKLALARKGAKAC